MSHSQLLDSTDYAERTPLVLLDCDMETMANQVHDLLM